MQKSTYKFTFEDSVDLDELEATVLLSLMGVESLHGADARLDASHVLDRAERTCLVDASTDAGRDLARLLAGYLSKEFGSEAFQISTIHHSDPKVSMHGGI